MSVDPTGTFIWDTDKYQASQTMSLLTATYTLFVYDANKSLDDTPEAGYLSGSFGYPFGMYRPESYTPLNGEFTSARTTRSLSLTYSRIQMCHLQRRHFRHPTPGPQVRRGHGPHHHPLLHLVHRWGRPPLDLLRYPCRQTSVTPDILMDIFRHRGAFHCFEKRFLNLRLIAREPAFVDTADMTTDMSFFFGWFLGLCLCSHLSACVCISCLF